MQNQPRKECRLICPVCKGKTRTRVQEDTVLVNFPLFCPKCKAVTRVHYVRENMQRFLGEEYARRSEEG